MAIVTATQKRENEGGGTGEEREGSVHCPKKWKGCAHQGMSEQDEREGVKRGATGGQEDGRATSNIRERAQKGSEG